MASVASADATTVVNPASSNWSKADTRPGGVVSFSAEFGAPSGFGTGALKMTTADGNGSAKAQYFTAPAAPIALADVDNVTYRSFRSSQSTGNPIQSPTAQFYLDPDGPGPLTFAPLVFEPYYTYGAPAVDTWQTWDGGGTAQWWSNKPIGDIAAFSYIPLSDYQAAAPDAVITSYGFNLGSGNAGIVSAVDGLEISTADTTTYDFEPLDGIVVDDDGAGSVGDCDSSTPAFSTISAAAAVASAGDTVNVCAGDYTENIVPGKSLTFLGAQAGNDARLGRIDLTQESVIHGYLNANGISGTTVDGFYFTDNTGSPSSISFAGGSGHTVVNTVIADNQTGNVQHAIYYVTDGTLPSLFSQNRITDNRLHGIFGSLINNVTISDNAFAGNGSSVVHFAPAPGTSSNVLVSGNTSDGDDNFIVGSGVDHLTVTGNTVSNTGGTGSLFGGDFSNVTITGNSITGSFGSGLAFTNDFGGPNSGVTITSNTLTGNARGISFPVGGYTGPAEVHFNRIVDNSTVADGRLAIRNLSAGSVNAEDNWYGCNEGTTGTDCDKDVGTVDTTPFLQLAISVSPAQITGTSTVTADLTRNSAGVDRSSAGTIPPTPVTFAASKGQLGATSGTLVNGKATTTITNNSDVGPGTLSATVDHETVSTNVTFVSPQLSITDATVSESGGQAVFTVTLDMPSQNLVTFNYATSGGTAASGADFTGVTSSGQIPAGQTSVNLSVPIIQDQLDENNETFTVTLSNASTAITDGSGTGTITDDDAAPSASVANAAPVVEGQIAAFVVSLSAPSGKVVTMRITTRNDSAVAPRDYDADGAVTTLTFAPGEVTKTAYVTTNLDQTRENAEKFKLGFYQPVNVTVRDQIGVGTIRKNNT